MIPALIGALGALGGAAIPAITQAVQNRREKIRQKKLMSQTGNQGQYPNYVPNTQTGNWFTGYGAQTQQLPRFTSAQESIMQQLAQQGAQAFNPNALEERARRDFSRRTLPQIAESFSSSGQNALSSPSFINQLGQAGAGLEENLADLRARYAQSMLGMGLQPTFENIYLPGTSGAATPLMQSLGQALPGLTQEGIQALMQWLSSRNQQQINQQQQVTPQSSMPGVSSSFPTSSPTLSNLFAVSQKPSLPSISGLKSQVPLGSTLGNMQFLQQNSLFR